MSVIRRDYIAKELRDMALLTALLAVAVGAAIPTAQISPLFLLLLPLFAVWFLIRMFSRAGAGMKVADAWPEAQRAQVGREYQEEHLICRVAYGEIHLLESCVVCRHKRRLLLIPVDELISVSRGHRLVGVKRVPMLHLNCSGGRRYTLDFFALHAENGEFVYAWLATRARNAEQDGGY